MVMFAKALEFPYFDKFDRVGVPKNKVCWDASV
jgi:hypothetical protein